MSKTASVYLNQMGLAVMLLDPSQLSSMSLHENPDLHTFSDGKTYVLKEQAKVFLKEVPNKLLRKYFCTVGSGEGIVIRVPARGPNAHYELSPFFRKALEVIPAPHGQLTDEIAEAYVGEVVRLANRLRGQRRSGRRP